MRKNKLLTGTLSLGLTMTIGVTSMSHVAGYESQVIESGYEAVSQIDVSTEMTANQVDTLMKSAESSTPYKLNTTLDTKKNNIDVNEVISNNSIDATNKKTSEKNAKKSEKKSEKKVKSSKESKKLAKKIKKNKDNIIGENLEYIGNYKITAYCACAHCCGKSTGMTASGTKATAGRTIAADTSVLPFGTKVVINDHVYTVEDRGGAINGNKIDIFCSSHQEALKWGVKYIDVYVQR